ALPYDHLSKLDQQRTGQGGYLTIELDSFLVDRILKYAQQCNVSLFQLALTCYYIFLFKLTNGEKDLCIGSVSSNRYRHELQNMIGMFVNTLPYRLVLDPTLTFGQLLYNVKELCLSILQYAYLPYQDIIQLHRAGTSTSNNNKQQQLAFFQTLFDFNSMNDSSSTTMIELDEQTQLYRMFGDYNDRNVAKFDITLSVNYDAQQSKMSCSFEYTRDLFESKTIENMANSFQVLLQQLFSNLSSFDKEKQPLYELSLLLPTEVRLLNSINQTYVDFGHETKYIHHEFVNIANKHPQKLAILLDDQSLTYCETSFYVQQMAHHFIKNINVKPKQIICQCVERSIEMVISVLATLVAGCVYCPLYHLDGIERLYMLIQSTHSQLVLVHSQTESKFDSLLDKIKNENITLFNTESFIINKISLSTHNTQLLNVEIDSTDIAYLIHTSGSTGKPKGVQISHNNFISYVHSAKHVSLINDMHVFLQISSCSFDIHVEDLLASLMLGASLVMLKTLDIDYLSSTVERHQVTRMHTVPTITSLLCDYLEETNSFQRLKTIQCFCSIGEAIVPRTVAKLAANLSSDAIIYNLYGPAECTIASTYHMVNEKDLNASSIPIGHPLPNYQCYILDQYLQPVKISEIGEIYIGGVGVFKGYLSNELTAQALVHLPNIKVKCYKTGDLGKYDVNGEITYCGRIDFQVKLRGQRLELGEIENVIMKSSPNKISNCVVNKVHDDKTKQDYLVAYIQMTPNSDMNEDKLKSQTKMYCQAHLPLYMVPTMFMILDKLPLNSNGKIDRKLLPKPDFAAVYLNDEMIIIEPNTDMEREICDLWCKILSLNKISMKQN
ncbi:unnamed protein product, partial [Didymodactylos carnosus]